MKELYISADDLVPWNYRGVLQFYVSTENDKDMNSEMNMNKKTTIYLVNDIFSLGVPI